MFYDAEPIIFENAKRLRKNMTEAELKLWRRVSNNELGVKFRPKRPVSSYVEDFYCHKDKLIIEVDGAIHFKEEAQQNDELRTEELEQLNLKVIRFTNEQVLKDVLSVLKEIRKVLTERIT